MVIAMLDRPHYAPAIRRSKQGGQEPGSFTQGHALPLPGLNRSLASDMILRIVHPVALRF